MPEERYPEAGLLRQDSLLTDLYKNVQKDLGDVEGELRQIGKSSNALINEINSYLFQKPGKRIRPALLILCSKLCDYQGKAHIFWSAVIELIHTASLIHDDIVDNSNLRRGKDTVHSRWGPNITVLLGDYLYIKSIAISLETKNNPVIDLLSEISTRMIEGELIEYSMSGNLDIAESQYFDILEKKTASLFAASCQIGGLLGNASAEDVRVLHDFGANLGMSFQIIDDLLDFSGDEETLGKPVLSDLNEGRITLPLIYTFRHGGKIAQKHLPALLKDRRTHPASQEEILKIVKSNGALDYTFQKAVEFTRKSKDVISLFPKSAYQESLLLMADFILNRKK
ncbi:MAG: polyprenyl synthetase family protein [Candidatus Aminicenantales bacterium]